MYLRLVVLLSLAFGVSGRCVSKDTGMMYWEPFGSFCYAFVYGMRLTEPRAARYCSHIKGTLVVPTTNSINLFLTYTLKRLERDHDVQYLIGLKDGLSMERLVDPFMWADGTDFDPTGDFTQFGPGQGTNATILGRQGKKCAAIGIKGQWWSVHCGKAKGHRVGRYRFICQVPKISKK